MKYLTKAGVKFLKEAYQNEEDDKKPKPAKTKGDILQGIARKHFKLITRGRKDSEAAKRLRAAYQQNEEDDKKSKLKLSTLIDLPLPKARPVGKNPDNLQQGNTNKSQNNPGHIKRMYDHIKRMAAKEILDIKLGRDVNEGSRGVNRIIRRVKAGHLDRNAPTVKEKGKDQLARYKELTDQHTDAGGPDRSPATDKREKNVKGAVAALDKGMEDTTRLPNVLRTTHEFAKSSDPQAEKEHASATRTPHAVRAVKRALSRGIGAYVPERDRKGTVTTLAKQRKEDSTLDKDISNRAKAYRRIRSRRVPPSMN